jgi:hypothetical protein
MDTMQLKPGMRLESQTCSTTVMVIKAPAGDVDLQCGGLPMAAPGSVAEKSSPVGDQDGGTLMGKRYGSDELTLELLCNKPGAGRLTIGDEPIPLKEAKPLPSSD